MLLRACAYPDRCRVMRRHRLAGIGRTGQLPFARSASDSGRRRIQSADAAELMLKAWNVMLLVCRLRLSHYGKHLVCSERGLITTVLLTLCIPPSNALHSLSTNAPDGPHVLSYLKVSFA